MFYNDLPSLKFKTAAEPYFESSISSTCRQRIPAHDGGCASILFEYKSSKLISGGQDREIKICGTFRSNANRVASNGSRSCISADDVGQMVRTLKEHTYSVLSCSWSGLGNPLATSDKSGIICIW
uniref:Uncharacterized protein n=1 Tax=Solanum lycopersicum TaxID=4081 RepID=A0A3Q7GEB5_SOLLC